MRIDMVEVFVVNMPMNVAITSSFASESGTTRTIVRIKTDEGVVGYGESHGGRVTADIVERHREVIVGTDPYELEIFQKNLRMVPFFYGYAGYSAIAAVEMAYWDIIGKDLDVPLHRLIGGAFRDEVAVTAILTRGLAGERSSGTDLAGALVEVSHDLINRWGFPAMKLKGSKRIDEDVTILEHLREVHPLLNLRVDPNAAWSVTDTVRAAPVMEDLDLEYVEDPCWGLESMARVRSRTRLRLCTNMCVVRLEDFAPSIHLGAVDIIHADPHKWGGIGPTRRLAALCDGFGIGLNMHSGGELGISTACNIHLGVALPELTYAIDSLYYFLTDDVITQPHELEFGAFCIPDGPGLGIHVDEAKLAHYAELNAVEGDYRH